MTEITGKHGVSKRHAKGGVGPRSNPRHKRRTFQLHPKARPRRRWLPSKKFTAYLPPWQASPDTVPRRILEVIGDHCVTHVAEGHQWSKIHNAHKLKIWDLPSFCTQCGSTSVAYETKLMRNPCEGFGGTLYHAKILQTVIVKQCPYADGWPSGHAAHMALASSRSRDPFWRDQPP